MEITGIDPLEFNGTYSYAGNENYRIKTVHRNRGFKIRCY